MKPKAEFIRKVAHRHGVSFQRALRMIARRGGRKSGAARRKPEQPTLL